MNVKNNPISKSEKIICNSCNRVTNHEILFEKIFRDDKTLIDDDGKYSGDVWWITTYTLFVCRGCENVTLRKTYEWSEWEDGNCHVDFYPPRVSRNEPKWFIDLPENFKLLAEEIYVALHAGCRRLALMGSRTLLDLLLLEKVGDGGSFADKLKKLEQLGLLSTKHKEILNTVLDAGSAATHRGYNPASDDLNAVVDIIENLLQLVYVLDVSSNELKHKIPQRKQRKAL